MHLLSRRAVPSNRRSHQARATSSRLPPRCCPGTRRVRSSFTSHILEAVMTVAPLCKHPGFAEEREWRLLLGPLGLRGVDVVHFVGRPQTLAPYIEFGLADRDNALDDIHWMAGPGPQQDRANQALGMVARIAGMKHYHGTNSQTPYLP